MAMPGVCHNLSNNLEDTSVSTSSHVGCNVGELHHSMSQGCQTAEQLTLFKTLPVVISVIVKL